MSRPFSYHDENFTVIDNLLFVHFIDSSKREAYEPVIQVPTQISKRMCSFGNVAVQSSIMPREGGITAGICVVIKDNKPYLAFTESRPSSTFERYYYCFYSLVDI